MAERMDTVVQHGDDGGRGFTVARARQRRPWRRKSDGEGPGGKCGVCKVGGCKGVHPTWTGRRGERRGGGSCVARMRCSPSSTCLLGQAKLLAGGVAGLGRQVGLVGGAR